MKIFHGGCSGCSMQNEHGIDYCKGCKYFNFGVGEFPSLNDSDKDSPNYKGKYKEGDIVVSLSESKDNREIGEIFRVIKVSKHKKSIVHYKNVSGLKCYTNEENFRGATKPEVQFFKEEHSKGSNIKNIGKSFEENSKYKSGDKIKVKSGLRSGLSFGTHHYPEGVGYIGGETLTVKRVNKRGEYIMEEKGIRLDDDLIGSKVEASFNWELPEQKLYFNSLVPGKYYRFEHISNEDKYSIVKFKEHYITPYALQNNDRFREWSNISFSNTDWRASIKKATEKEIEWLNYCVDKNQFKSKEVFNNYRASAKKKRYKEVYSGGAPKPETFPTHGWCPNPSEELIKYVAEKFNKGRRPKTGKQGFAWQSNYGRFGNSVWKIEGSSSYPMFYTEQLEDFLPKTRCADIETGGLWTQIGAGKSGKTSMGSWLQGMHREEFDREHLSMPKVVDYGTDMARNLSLRNYQIQSIDRHGELSFGYPGDSAIASTMAIQAAGRSLRKEKDDFTQQEPVLLKSKKKKRKLIV